ncbi:MAG TPA: response regulator transcription factor [Solirubrobacteraceae bacterium]|nr:response regulator transcription factor [Solirubrobacteraceae bacterium]
MDPSRPQVLIVDDHLAVRRALELLLRDAGFAIASSAEPPAGARSLLLHGQYDVALLELRLDRGDGLQLARDVLRERPDAPLLLYTGYADPFAGLAAAAGLGVPGLVLTASPPEALIDAVRAVAGGATYRDPEVDARLAANPQSSRLAALTRREWEVLRLLADGYAGPDIAAHLHLSLETVRTHIRNATTKLGARTRVQAAALVARNDGHPLPPAAPAPDAD